MTVSEICGGGVTVSEICGGGVGRVQNVGLGPILAFSDMRENLPEPFFFSSFFSPFFQPFYTSR